MVTGEDLGEGGVMGESIAIFAYHRAIKIPKIAAHLSAKVEYQKPRRQA